MAAAPATVERGSETRSVFTSLSASGMGAVVVPPLTSSPPSLSAVPPPAAGTVGPWTRPDVRGRAAAVAAALLDAHRRCLEENFLPDADADADLLVEGRGGGGSPSYYRVLHDDDVAAPAASASTTTATTAVGGRYHPLLHRTLESLCRAAAASAPGPDASAAVTGGGGAGAGSVGLQMRRPDHSDSVARLLAVAAALALGGAVARRGRAGGDDDGAGGGRGEEVVVVDARLASFALERLSECLVGLVVAPSSSSPPPPPPAQPQAAGAGGGSSDDGGKDGGPAAGGEARALPAQLVRRYKLDCPLAAPLDPWIGPFGGAFPPPAADDGDGDSPGAGGGGAASNDGVGDFGLSSSALERQARRRRDREGEFLSLFLRASSSSSSSSSRCASGLLVDLLRIAQCCYRAGRGAGIIVGGGGGAEEPELTTMTYARCSLAADALDALRRCLLLGPDDGDGVDGQLLSPSTSLRSSLRPCGLTADLVRSAVDAGYAMDKGLVRPRIALALRSAGVDNDDGDDDDHDDEDGPQGPMGHTKLDHLSFLSAASLCCGGNEFEPWERRLWTSHIKLCLTIGRGQPSFTPVQRSVLGDGKSRLWIFQAVSAGRLVHDSDISKAVLPSTQQPQRWPLFLPAVQHALVASNLTREPYPKSSREAAPEKFLCDAFLASLQDALDDPRLATDKSKTSPLGGGEPPRREGEVVEEGQALALTHGYQQRRGGGGSSCIRTTTARVRRRRVQISDEVTALSLRDARLLTLAVSRLPRKEQSRVVSRLADLLGAAAARLAPPDSGGDEAYRGTVLGDAAATGLLARAVTVCSALVDLSCAGRGLAENLRLECGPDNYHLPSFVEIDCCDDDADDEDQQECDWYGRERSYMGLFSDWESPALPADAVVLANLDASDPLPKAQAARLRDAFEALFRAGFDSAPTDHCHLLFASWNALGKSSPWDGRTWAGPSSATSLHGLGYAQKLVKLREDICHVFRHVITDSATVPETLLTELIKKRDETRRRMPKRAVRDTLKVCVDAAASITDGFLSDTMSDPVESSALAVGEAVAVYLSFLMSLYTRPTGEFLSSYGDKPIREGAGGRRRKSSSLSADSEDGMMEEDNALSDDSAESDDDGGGYPDFDGEDDEDARADALARLHDTGTDLGASPFHPDWLDVSCRFREGMTETSATEAAEKAISILTRLGEVARQQHIKSLEKAISLSGISTPQASESLRSSHSALALRIITALRDVELNEDDNPSSPHRSVCSLAASLFKIDVSSLELVVDGVECQNKISAKESWGPNSAHRIRGKLQEYSNALEGFDPTPCEMRTSQEWELLISDSLIGACADIDVPTSVDLGTSSLDEQSQAESAQRYFVQAERWQRVLQGSVSALCSAAALLRFALNGGKGRQPHPLSKKEGSTSTLFPSSPLPDRRKSSLLSYMGVSQQQLKDSINKSIAFLAKVSSETQAEIFTSKTCRAVACHMVGDSKHFVDLEAMHSLQCLLSGVVATYEILLGEISEIEDRGKHAEAIIDRFLAAIETLADPTTETVAKPDIAMKKTKLLRLLAVFGFPAALRIDTLAEALVDQTRLLSQWPIPKADAVEVLVKVLAQKHVKLRYKTRAKVAHILSSLLELEQEQIHFNPDVLGQGPVVLPIVLTAFNSLDDDDLKNLTYDICHGAPACEASEIPDEFSQSLCSIVMRLIGMISLLPNREENEGRACKILLQSLLSYLQKAPLADHVIDLISLLATRFDLLKDAGMTIMSLVISEKAPGGVFEVDRLYLAVLERFVGFVQDLHERLIALDGALGPVGYTDITSFQSHGHISETEQESRSNCDATYYITKSGDRIRRTCSFVETGGDFKEQHWYNCYTCGLLWDKGCCSLCVLVCHKGHDVGYSRKSSFFCDCGAEVATAGEQNRVACRCLSPLSNNDMSAIFDEHDSRKKYDAAKEKQAGATKGEHPKLMSKKFDIRKQAIDAAAHSFPSQSKTSLQHTVEEAKASCWTQSLIQLFNICFETWAVKKTTSKLMVYETPTLKETTSLDEAVGEECISTPQMLNRNGKVLDIAQLREKSMIPIRAAKASALNLKLSIDSTTDRLKKAILSKNDIKRQVVVSDSRGRLIIAEPCSLIFCGALPIVNIRHVEKHTEAPLDRAQMCIRGTSKLKFNIVGMQLCSNNNRHLVVWGTSEACIVVLNKACDKVEKRIDLLVELEPHECETEYLLKCDWLPQSETMVVAICGTFVKVFDMRRSTSTGAASENEFTCRSSTCYTLAYEDVLIRSGTLIGNVDKDTSGESNNWEASSTVRMALMFDSGRLHFSDMAVDSNGDLEDQGESYIECGDGAPFPTAGIRRYGSATPGSPGSTSTSFGEGSSVVYLKQSGLLLYKCISSCLVALILDDQGKVAGSFELLPHVLTSEKLGTGVDGYSISAPYSNWTELGTVTKNRSCFYRAACVGKSTRTNQPKLLLVEFNEYSVNVKELSWVGGSSMGLGLSLNTCFEGLAAFSGPFLTGENSGRGSVERDGSFCERAFLAALTSNGSMLIFGEDFDESTVYGDADFAGNIARSDFVNSGALARSTNDDMVPKNELKPSFPLTIFEKLINVSQMEELTFGGDGVGNEPESVKRKLSISNGEFIISPGVSGCTLTVSLNNPQVDGEEKHGSTDGPNVTDSISRTSRKVKSSSRSETNGLVIVAVRILLGSTTTDYLPKSVTVMGRPVKLAQGVKRWYDLPLTDEEVMLGVRSGFVSIGIGPSFDSSNSPLVDAVEVYTLRRDDMPFLSPTFNSTKKVDAIEDPSECQQDVTTEFVVTDEERFRKSLDLSMLSVMHMSQVLGEGVEPSQANRKTMGRLIQVTALDSGGRGEVRKHVMELLGEVESDPRERQLLIDEGTLFGVMEAIKDIQQVLEKASETKNCPTDHEHLEKLDVERPLLSPAVLTDVLSTLKRCLESSLDIVMERPENYRNSVQKMVAEGVSNASIAVESKRVLDLSEMQSADFSLSAANLTKLAVLEKLIESGQSSSSSCEVKYADFNLILDLLRSSNKDVVEHVCSAIIDAVGNAGKINETQGQSLQKPSDSIAPPIASPPIAYQCDSCQTFPITGLRYTLEGGHDIDLCQRCYDAGIDFARAHRQRTGTALSIRGKTLRLGNVEDMTCEQLWQMRRVPIARTIVEQVEQAKRAAKASSQSSSNDVSQFDSAAMDDDDEAAALQLALQMSLEDNQIEVADVSQNATDFQEPMDTMKHQELVFALFTNILDMAVNSLTKDVAESSIFHLAPLLNLLLCLVLKAETAELQLECGTKMAARVCERIRLLIEIFPAEESNLTKESSNRLRCSLVTGLRVLVSLTLRKETLLKWTEKGSEISGIEDIPEADTDATSQSDAKNKGKTDPRFVCDVHGVPAVRRRCSRGVHKDRRFYVCGMGRKQRCKYFKWADTGGEDNSKAIDSSSLQDSQPLLSGRAASTGDSHHSLKMQTELWALFCRGTPSLQSQLCDLLQVCFERSDCCAPSRSLRDKETDRETIEKSTSLTESLQSEKTRAEEWCDGVIYSKEKLFSTSGRVSEKVDATRIGASSAGKDMASSVSASSNDDSSIVLASLDMLSLIASNSVRGLKEESGEPINFSNWWELLCEIISTSSTAYLRAQSKKMLKRLCGGRRAVYHRVRDHYIFGFQFRNLLEYCEGPLSSALVARERARRCGPLWRGADLTWATLLSGDLIGVGDLISEDSLTVIDHGIIEKAMEELTNIARKSVNWRQFCGLNNLPRGRSKKTCGYSGFLSMSGEGRDICCRPPITSLYWIACSIPGPIQVKAFELMEVALNFISENEAETSDTDKLVQGTEESCGLLSTDVGTDPESSRTADHQMTRAEVNTPEQSLFAPHQGITIEDVYAFVMQFVLRGKTPDLRSVASKVAQSLFRNVAPSDLNILFFKFVNGPLREIGRLGCASIDYLELLQAFVSKYGNSSSVEVGKTQYIVVSCFTQQIHTMNRILHSEEMGVIEVESENGKITKKRFDLTNCVHCHRQRLGSLENKQDQAATGRSATLGSTTTRTARSGTVSTSSPTESTPVPNTGDTRWLPGQVRPYTRGRLDASTEKAVSAEFTSFVQLKFRLAISEVHLSVSDPRGRLVKTIGIYFTPRQVGDVSELKTEEYSPLWQKCGTLSLSRGGTRASLKLSTPVIAANLKLGYMEFYERSAGGTRSSDGGLLLHCPRCTRVVNNAHGVCGHCGEVAFQCRKCRHINYDRLDAFLCVECGYCASGGFSYELTAGVASNAVAIVDEEGFDRAVKLLRISSRRQSDMRSALKKKLTMAASARRKRTRGVDFDDLDGLNKYSPPLKRALLGELPKSTGRGSGDGDSGGGGDSPGKRRSSGAPGGLSSRRGDQSSRMLAANKARSLLSLARQLCNDSSSGGLDSDRSSRGDLLVRQALLNAGAGSGSLEFFDEAEGDMFGIMNASGDSGVLNPDMPDPLSRLVANIQARVRSSGGAGADDSRHSGGSGGGGGGSGDGDSSGNGGRRNDSPHAQTEECDKMHQQMREAEKESSELLRTINAWNCLNSDSLADHGSVSRQLGPPSFIPTTCASCSGAVTFHLLVLVMAVFRIDMKSAEHAFTREFIYALFDEQFTLNHKLHDLKRFSITQVVKSKIGAKLVFNELQTRLRATQDIASAEILGKLIEKDFPMVEEYVQLAMEVLSEGQ